MRLLARLRTPAICLMWIAFSIESLTAETSSSTSTHPKPIHVLLVTGGCCHDYDFQTKALQLAVKEAGINAVWTVAAEGGKSKDAQFSIYEDENWSAGFDVVVHNECFAKTTDADYIARIAKAHYAGTPAVVVHCAMHTYREAKIDDWREMLGVTSRRHDHQSRYPVTVSAPDHPIMRDFPASYVTQMDELYIIEKQWPSMVPLATSVSERDGKSHPVFWTNKYGDAQIFGTTYGHSSAMFEDQTFLQTLTRGMLWAAGRLN
ncbi:MAG: ThuA domain-containing protein [Planctomycetota bacterium]